MQTQEKEISFVSTKSYSTLNNYSDATKNVWLVFHGMGYLSRYFLKYFKSFDAEKNYFIAPQAPSKYYMPPQFKHVGASWLTRENTLTETQNVLRYVDAVAAAEKIAEAQNLIVLGYSQGVSIAMRYVAARKLKCEHLIVHSGGIPKELKATDFEFLKDQTTVSRLYGTKDEYLNDERLAYESARFKELFSDQARNYPFEGIHEVHTPLIKEIVSLS